MTYVNDFKGPCLIQVKGDCIIIKQLNRSLIGNWPYGVIRKFRFDDDKKQFSFESGRRGPFGVAEYLFKLNSRTYFYLRETVNRIAEGRSGTQPVADLKDKPPVPPHGRNSDYKRRHKSQDHLQEIPVIRSLRNQRSTSYPDLSDNLSEKYTPRSNSGSIRSTRSNESRRDSDGTLPSMNQDYQVPRAATENIYCTPRLRNDPRNDYQIPRPMEKTYMVPTPYVESSLVSKSNSDIFVPQSSLQQTILESSQEFAASQPILEPPSKEFVVPKPILEPPSQEFVVPKPILEPESAVPKPILEPPSQDPASLLPASQILEPSREPGIPPILNECLQEPVSESALISEPGVVPQSVSESAVPQSVSESAVPQSVSESAVPQSVSESAVPQSVSESAVPQSVSESAVPQSVSESAVPQSVSESAVPLSVSESAVPQSVSESAVPQSVSESAVPQQITRTIEHSYEDLENYMNQK